jgi:hypothetical protein
VCPISEIPIAPFSCVSPCYAPSYKKDFMTCMTTCVFSSSRSTRICLSCALHPAGPILHLIYLSIYRSERLTILLIQKSIQYQHFMKLSLLKHSTLRMRALTHTPASRRWMSVRPMMLQSGTLPTRKSTHYVIYSFYRSDTRLQIPRVKK